MTSLVERLRSATARVRNLHHDEYSDRDDNAASDEIESSISDLEALAEEMRRQAKMVRSLSTRMYVLVEAHLLEEYAQRISGEGT